jgi:sterol desaturase/sphingolipid hydroxylase (fatty acid hydroxylase superfamily)
MITALEKAELTIIPIIAIMVWFFAPLLPNSLNIGLLLLGVSALLLLQGLIRDLRLLANKRGNPQPDLQRKIRCMCAESTIGTTGIIAGAAILGVGIDYSIGLSQFGWCIIFIVVMTIGFLIKDYVIEWNPFHLRKDKDHINIVFTWKK